MLKKQRWNHTKYLYEYRKKIRLKLVCMKRKQKKFTWISVVSKTVLHWIRCECFTVEHFSSTELKFQEVDLGFAIGYKSCGQSQCLRARALRLRLSLAPALSNMRMRWCVIWRRLRRYWLFATGANAHGLLTVHACSKCTPSHSSGCLHSYNKAVSFTVDGGEVARHAKSYRSRQTNGGAYRSGVRANTCLSIRIRLLAKTYGSHGRSVTLPRCRSLANSVDLASIRYNFTCLAHFFPSASALFRQLAALNCSFAGLLFTAASQHDHLRTTTSNTNNLFEKFAICSHFAANTCTGGCAMRAEHALSPISISIVPYVCSNIYNFICNGICCFDGKSFKGLHAHLPRPHRNQAKHFSGFWLCFWLNWLLLDEFNVFEWCEVRFASVRCIANAECTLQIVFKRPKPPWDG